MNESKDKGYTIYCSRCGSEMNSNSRYCMKCGNLNYDHSANANMKNYIKNDNSSYQVGSGKSLIANDLNQNRVVYAINTGNKTFSFYATLILYLFSLIISFILTNRLESFNVMDVLNSFFPYFMILFSVIFFYLYSLQLVFVKCNRPWWASLIPIYNLMVLSDIIYHKKWIGLLCVVPIIGIVVGFILLYQLGKKFKFNGLLTAIFPFIFIPLIGFGNKTFDGFQFVNDKNSLEKDFKRKKIILVMTLLFFIIGIIFIGISNQSAVMNEWSNLKKYYYVYSAKKIVSKTNNKFDRNDYSCDNTTNNVEYYFYYSNIEDYVYIPFSYLRDGASGYVKIVVIDGKKEIYVSLNDGKNGIPLILVDDIDIDKVIEYSEDYSTSDFPNYCKID